MRVSASTVWLQVLNVLCADTFEICTRDLPTEIRGRGGGKRSAGLFLFALISAVAVMRFDGAAFMARPLASRSARCAWLGSTIPAAAVPAAMLVAQLIRIEAATLPQRPFGSELTFQANAEPDAEASRSHAPPG